MSRPAVPDAYTLALRLLGQRGRSTADLAARLRSKGCAEQAIDSALQRCHELGYLDDARLAAERAGQLVRAGRAIGPALQLRLQREGFDSAVCHQATAAYTDADLQRRQLAAVAERRFGDPARLSADARQQRRLIQYLQRRGFALSQIFDYLNERQINVYDDR